MVTNRILWMVLSAVAAAVAGAATRKVVDLAWQGTTGEPPPPEQDDGPSPLPKALSWAAGVGAAAGVARVMSKRVAGKAYEKVTGETPPGEVDQP